MSAPHFSPEIASRMSRITALVLDVDGVLTDGRIVYDEFGDELKFFHVQDGTGLTLWHRAGLLSAMITARRSKMVERRAKELQVDFVAQKALSKFKAFEQFLKRFKLAPDQVCAVGDDLMELPILRKVGLAVAVSNAVEEVKQAAHYVTTKEGGHGAVREVTELILKHKGLWNAITERYYTS